MFKVKKGITQITFEGNFVEGGATVKATLDDIPDDIKDLIECGVYTEEEALARCSTNGKREQRMIFTLFSIRKVREFIFKLFIKWKLTTFCFTFSIKCR